MQLVSMSSSISPTLIVWFLRIIVVIVALISVLKKRLSWIMVGSVFFILYAVSTIGLLGIFNQLLSYLKEGHAEATYLGFTITPLGWVGLALALALFRVGFYMLGHVALESVAIASTNDLQKQLFHKVHKAPLPWIEVNQNKMVNSYFNQHADAIHLLFKHLLVTGILNSALVVVYLSYMVYLSWSLSLLFMVVVAISNFILRGQLTRLSSNIRQYLNQSQSFGSFLEEFLQGIKIVRVFGQSAYFESEGLRLFNQRKQLLIRNAKIQPLIPSFNELSLSLFLIGLMAILIIFPAFFNAQHIIIFIPLILLLAQSVRGIIAQLGQILNGYNAFISLHQFLQTIPQEPNHLTSTDFTPQPNSPLLTLRNLSLELEQKPILHNINLSFKPAQYLCLVGESGSGKTSLMNSLLQFQPHYQGEILYQGIPLNPHNTSAFYQQISIVTQNNFLFEATLQDNLTNFQTTPNQTLLAEVLHQVGLTSFVAELPLGLKTPLHFQANNISGGQKQRIALARALYRQTPILIIDEALSSLDPVLVKSIIQHLKNLSRHRLIISISHNTYEWEQCDQVIYIDKGSVVIQAPHLQALNNPNYAQFYRGLNAT